MRKGCEQGGRERGKKSLRFGAEQARSRLFQRACGTGEIYNRDKEKGRFKKKGKEERIDRLGGGGEETQSTTFRNPKSDEAVRKHL